MQKIGSKELQKYVAAKKVLIAEPSVPFSTVIQQTMVAMGCQMENIFKEADLRRALHLVERERPEIIISEYNLGTQFGLELAEKQSHIHPDHKERIFILVTRNASDSAIAEAAEEEVDGYILKPFNLNQLQETFLEVMHKKMNPSEYVVKIHEGRDLLNGKDLKNAFSTFTQARKMDPKPSLACYYQGFTKKLDQDPEAALKYFREGKAFNPLHYKCLQAEFDILFEQKKEQEAYEVIKVINGSYPVSPNTLAKMFLLAIYTYNYKDIEKYYEIFTQLDRRSEDLIKIVSAALYSAGRFCLKENDVSQACEFFRKGVTVAQRDRAYLFKVITTLLKLDQHEEVEKFITLFEPDDRDSMEYRQIEFELMKSQAETPKIVEKGRQLIAEGQASEDVFRTVVKALIEMNKPLMAEEVIFKAGKEFPEMKNELYQIIKSAKSA